MIRNPRNMLKRKGRNRVKKRWSIKNKQTQEMKRRMKENKKASPQHSRNNRRKGYLSSSCGNCKRSRRLSRKRRRSKQLQRRTN
jgi:hypothetical protein